MEAVATQKVIRVIPAKPELDLKRPENRMRRVAAYCRVSTDQKEQLASFEAQRDYYTEKIMSNPEWSFVEIFADEGITGTQAKKRKDFMRMLRMCRQGKIDMILTKSVSRFARNTVECLQFIRELKELGITVIFEKEGIDTMKMASELSISFISAFAQSESESISGNVTWGKRKAFSNGSVPFIYKTTLGYRKGEDGRPEIDENEARIVRRIFDEFLSGKSVRLIAESLEADEIPSPSGKQKWPHSTIQSMLSNVKYKGDALLQKTYIVDCISKKSKKNNGELPQYYINGNHPAIIDSDTFDHVQLEIAKRRGKPRTSEKQAKTMLGKYSSKYALTELLICGNCGSRYRRVTWARNGKKKVVWRCVSRLDYGTKYCKDSPTVEETVLQDAIVCSINSLLSDKRECLEVLKMNIRRGLEIGTVGNDEYSIKLRMDELRKSRDVITQKIVHNEGDMAEFETQFKLIADELQELNNQLVDIENNRTNAMVSLSILDEVTDIAYSSDTPMTEYNDAIVRQIVEQIRVQNDNSIDIIFIGGITEKARF